MKKWIAGFCAMVMLVGAACCALAAGVTLRTFTPFADLDAAAQRYMDVVTEWEAATGNVVEDYSGLTDEAWTQNMLDMVRAGEADVVIVPLGTGLTYDDLVTAKELMEAVPDLGVRSLAASSINCFKLVKSINITPVYLPFYTINDTDKMQVCQLKGNKIKHTLTVCL